MYFLGGGSRKGLDYKIYKGLKYNLFLQSPSGFPVSLVKLALTKMSLVWQVFGGNDLSDSKEMKYNTKAFIVAYFITFFYPR